MTAPLYFYVITIGLSVIGCGTRLMAEGDVIIVAPTTAATNSAPQKPVAPDGTPVVHKSSHKKNKTPATGAAVTSVSGAGASSTTLSTSTAASSPATSTSSPKPSASGISSSPPSKTATAGKTPASSPSKVPSPGGAASSSLAGSGPTVETGLPIARHSTPIEGGGLFPSSTSPGTYPSSNPTASPTGNFVFANFNKRSKNTYPWKSGIYTTMFWIGEGGSTISSTDNIGSAWDEDWRTSNRGNDSPYDRSGFAPADHAPTVNPFYVALPFNDLAYPDKAARWLPAGWHRPNKDGKQVSACKDRWVQIKNAQGRSCYAQWEDVGPLRSDHAEYVFGDQ